MTPIVHSMLSSFLFSDDLLDPTDLFLDFAGFPFIFSFCFQVWIIAQFHGELLDLTLDLILTYSAATPHNAQKPRKRFAEGIYRVSPLKWKIYLWVTGKQDWIIMWAIGG